MAEKARAKVKAKEKESKAKAKAIAKAKTPKSRNPEALEGSSTTRATFASSQDTRKSESRM